MNKLQCKVKLERFARLGNTGRPIQTGETQTITVFVEDTKDAPRAAAEKMTVPAEWSAMSVQVVNDPFNNGQPPDPLDNLHPKSTAHVDRSGATVTTQNGAVYHFTSGSADPLRDTGDRRWWPIEPGTYTLSAASYRKAMAAVATCEQLGYTHEGGTLWCPSLGPKPDFAGIDRDRTLLGELLAVIHGDGGHHQNEHGTWRATSDAISAVHALRLKTEAVAIKVTTTCIAAAIDDWIAACKRDTAEAARVEFEDWYLTDMRDASFPEQTPGYMKSLRDGDAYGTHRSALNMKWKAWRAAKGLQ